MTEPIVLTRKGSDDPALYACGACGRVASPTIYVATKARAHQAAIEMATSCCAPHHCDDCGGEVSKHWTVCAPCRERRMLRKAKRVEWDGECMVSYHDDQFASGLEEFDDLELPPAYCHPCIFERFQLDAADLIENRCDDHWDGISDEIQGPHLNAVEAAIEAFNKATMAGSWAPDTKRVIVLDEARFAELIG